MTIQRLAQSGLTLPEYTLEIERALIQEALQRTDGNKARAAYMLGINRTTLLYRITKHPTLRHHIGVPTRQE